MPFWCLSISTTLSRVSLMRKRTDNPLQQRSVLIATAARVLSQLRHDGRSVALILGAPVLLLGLLSWVLSGQPGVFDEWGCAPSWRLSASPDVRGYIGGNLARAFRRNFGTASDDADEQNRFLGRLRIGIRCGGCPPSADRVCVDVFSVRTHDCRTCGQRRLDCRVETRC